MGAYLSRKPCNVRLMAANSISSSNQPACTYVHVPHVGPQYVQMSRWNHEKYPPHRILHRLFFGLRDRHPPYAANRTKCFACFAAIKPCPATCSVTTPTKNGTKIINKTTCETSWMEYACEAMAPPRKPRPPAPPKPYVPNLIGPSGCVITVGVKANPLDPLDSKVVALPGVLPFDGATMGVVTQPAKNAKESVTELEMLFDASTRASHRMVSIPHATAHVSQHAPTRRPCLFTSPAMPSDARGDGACPMAHPLIIVYMHVHDFCDEAAQPGRL